MCATQYESYGVYSCFAGSANRAAEGPRHPPAKEAAMHRMTDSEFESAVEEALGCIPERFLDALENVAVVVEDEPNDYHLETLEEPDCLGLPSATTSCWGSTTRVAARSRRRLRRDVPDVITVFKGPHERCFGSRAEIVEEIGKTVVHEIGHYFGIDDARLYEMGY